MQNQHQFKIGSADDADIRICEPTISQRHCELRWTGDTWVISDCDSTNGTFVNGRRISQPACLGPDDRVTLGRGVKLDLPAPPLTPRIAQMSEASQRSPLLSQKTVRRPRVAMLVMIGGTGLTCLLCGVVLIGFWLSQSPTLSDEREASTVNTAEVTVATTATPPRPPFAPQEVAVDAAATEKLSPVWALVAESADRKRRMLLGTAVAVESNRLLCLASLVDAADSVRSQYPVLALESPQSMGKLIPVRSHGLSPQYQSASTELVAFRKELQAKLDTLTESDEPELDESLAWSERLDAIMNKLTTNDMAYLVVAEPLPSFATTVAPDQLKPTICLLRGFPTVDTTPSITNDLEKYLLDGLEARWLPPQSEQDKATSSTIEFQSISSLVQPQSLACFDRQGSFIGLCGASESSVPAGETDRLPAVTFTKFW